MAAAHLLVHALRWLLLLVRRCLSKCCVPRECQRGGNSRLELVLMVEPAGACIVLPVAPLGLPFSLPIASLLQSGPARPPHVCSCLVCCQAA